MAGNFKKTHIPAKYYTIIEIGSYKMRFCSLRFKNGRIQILGYHEKRQDTSCFSGNECINIPQLCTNIADGLGAHEHHIGMEIQDIVVSYPFDEIHISSKKLSYKRENFDVPLKRNELEEILLNLGKLHFSSQKKFLEDSYGYLPYNLSVLLSRLYSFKVDGEPINDFSKITGERIQISELHILAPEEKLKLIGQIGKICKKEITHIIPSQYSLGELLKEKEVLLINIGASSTTLSYKKHGEIQGINKFPLGIHHLTSQIAKKYSLSSFEALESLQGKKYLEEINSFLDIWGSSYGLALEELLGKNLMPSKIFLSGGGANNDFLKNFILLFPYEKFEISRAKKLEYTSEDLAPVLSLFEHIKIDDLEQISLEMYSMIYELHNIFQREHDLVSTSLKRITPHIK